MPRPVCRAGIRDYIRVRSCTSLFDWNSLAVTACDLLAELHETYYECGLPPIEANYRYVWTLDGAILTACSHWSKCVATAWQGFRSAYDERCCGQAWVSHANHQGAFAAVDYIW